MDAEIECRELSLGYETGIVAEGLHFTVNRGDYLCILGENGSGKSTLVKALLGLHPAAGGTIVRNVSGIGYLPQQTVVQRDFPASVREIVRSGCLGTSGLRPFYTKAERDRAEQNMQRLGIADYAKRCYRDLSGGQQQRVLLARALCAADSMLLLDEPVTGLDPKAQIDLYELIASLNQSGITIIMVSHDVNAAVRYATHILHIGGKQQCFFGTAAAYCESEIGKTFLAEGGLLDERAAKAD